MLNMTMPKATMPKAGSLRRSNQCYGEDSEDLGLIEEGGGVSHGK